MPYPCVVAHCLVTFPVTCPFQFPRVPFLSHFLAKFQQTRKRPDLEEAGPHCLGVGRPEVEGRESWAPAPLLLCFSWDLGQSTQPGFPHLQHKGVGLGDLSSSLPALRFRDGVPSAQSRCKALWTYGAWASLPVSCFPPQNHLYLMSLSPYAPPVFLVFLACV